MYAVFGPLRLSTGMIVDISDIFCKKLRFFIAMSAKITNFVSVNRRSDARVAEEANLESLYTPKGYRGFESRLLRQNAVNENLQRSYFYVVPEY